MKKSFTRKYVFNKYTIIGVVVLLIASYFLFFRGSKDSEFEFFTAVIGNITEKVSVTGKISPVEKADLAFEKGGRVTAINVKVGDMVKRGDVIASLDSVSDRANLNSALAKLSDLSRGLNQQEMALELSKVNAAKVSLANVRQDVINTARSSLATTQGAVNNYADKFFDNPQEANPTINIRTESYTQKLAVESERANISIILKKWKDLLASATSTDSADNIISLINSYEISIKSFMDNLSRIVNDLNTGNSGLSRTTIDSHVSTMSSGLSALNQAIASIASSKTALENAVTNYDQIYNNFLLKNSGSSAESVAAQAAVVEMYRAELEKDKLVSPINGLITKVGLDLGEFVSPGAVVFGVMSDGDYKIEAYVPEADIAKVSIGNIASTTLDAYGQNIDFPSAVTSIDPAETVLEGVSTYRVVLQFIDRDERIKSGMTANLDILTNKKSDVITVPNRAIVTSGGQRSARIVNPDGKSFNTVPVQIGLRGSDGMTEVVSGIEIGDRVVTYVK